MRTRHASYDDINSRVASYESLLDLFTLLSLILIVASVFYVAQSAEQNQSASLVTALETRHGSGTPLTIPKDLLLLIISRENSSDLLTIDNGTTGISTNLNVTVNTIDNTLNSFAPTFARVSKIDIAVYQVKEDINHDILYDVQHWLGTHDHHNYSIYFSGTK